MLITFAWTQIDRLTRDFFPGRGCTYAYVSLEKLITITYDMVCQGSFLRNYLPWTFHNRRNLANICSRTHYCCSSARMCSIAFCGSCRRQTEVTVAETWTPSDQSVWRMSFSQEWHIYRRRLLYGHYRDTTVSDSIKKYNTNEILNGHLLRFNQTSTDSLLHVDRLRVYICLAYVLDARRRRLISYQVGI